MNGTSDLQRVMHQFLPGCRESHSLSSRQREVCAHICACRTEALGGMQLHCDHCDYAQPWYHACRDRHCPKCQWRATQAWSDQQCQAVLPVTYYPLVFTLPHELNPWGESRPFVQWTNAARRTTRQDVWAGTTLQGCITSLSPRPVPPSLMGRSPNFLCPLDKGFRFTPSGSADNWA